MNVLNWVAEHWFLSVVFMLLLCQTFLIALAIITSPRQGLQTPESDLRRRRVGPESAVRVPPSSQWHSAGYQRPSSRDNPIGLCD